MGILNLTPDSFSDAGTYLNTEHAIEKALQMAEEGAGVIDVGGESTRPGSKQISAQEEIDRVIPVIEKLKKLTAIPISIDTHKPQVMKSAINAGAVIVNDITALQYTESLEIIAKNKVGICLMHKKGNPNNMQESPSYHNVVDEVFHFLQQRVSIALKAGIEKNRILIDPGFGYGKTVEHNLKLLKNLHHFTKLECPILVGWSRKSTIGSVLNLPVDQRLYGSLACACLAVNNGAKIIRAHDIRATVEAIKMVNAVISISD